MRGAVSAAAIAVSLMLAISGCAGSAASRQEPTAPSGDCAIEDSLNATGQVIGQRAVMQMSKADAKAMSEKEFSVLVDEETAAADSDNADYLTIDLGDGTGMVFPSCTAEFFFYGELDSEGMMAGKSVSYHRNVTRWERD